MTTLARLITRGCTGLLATLPAFANSAAQDEAMIKLANDNKICIVGSEQTSKR